ncbi:MAG: SRPBCC family protein [Planctomycetota bacterium]
MHERTPDRTLLHALADPAEIEAVFVRAWHLAPLPRAATPLPPGRAEPWTLLEGCLDEPLLWLSDPQRTVRLFANVCTHRGRQLVEQPADCRNVRCPYHGRTFDLCGRAIKAPGFEAAGFPRMFDHLLTVPDAEWRGFRFGSVAPAVPFAEWIELAERFAGPLVEALPAEPTETRDYEVPAHWVFYLDNYLEGLHIPYVHQGLVPALDWSDYGIECHPHGSVQIGRAAPGEPVLELPADHPLHGQGIAALWIQLFPNTLLNVYPWGLSINLIEPLGAARTRVRYRVFVARPELRQQGAGADLERVEREDQAEVTAVQRGTRSRFWRGGRYAPGHEDAVRHFHGWLRGRLAEP